MKHKVIKAGKHSLAVIIPAGFAHGLGIKAGDSVDVKTSVEKGKMFISFSGIMQLLLPTSNN